MAALRGPLAELVASRATGHDAGGQGARAGGPHPGQRPTRGGTQEQLRGQLAELGRSVGLALEPGRHVLELRPPGSDKGAVLRELAAQVGARSVVFGGDDRGDLPAAAAVRELRAAGAAGLVVCVDSPESPPELRAAADLVVDGPAALVALLTTLADALDRRPGRAS